jgi:hypothetical protein
LSGWNIGHRRTFNEFLRLLRQQTGLRPHGDATHGCAGPQQLSSFHGDPSSNGAAPDGAAMAHQAA